MAAAPPQGATGGALGSDRSEKTETGPRRPSSPSPVTRHVYCPSRPETVRHLNYDEAPPAGQNTLQDADTRAVDGHPEKAQSLRTPESGDQESAQPQPHLSLDPLGQAAPAGHAETEPMRHLFSANPGAQDEQDALEHKPVRMPLAPGVPRPALNPGHQRPQRHPPLFIDIPQLRPSHPAPPQRQARSDPITSKIISSGVLEQSENLIQDPGNMSQFAQAVVHPNSSSSPVLTLESGAPSTQHPAPSTQAKPAIPAPAVSAEHRARAGSDRRTSHRTSAAPVTRRRSATRHQLQDSPALAEGEPPQEVGDAVVERPIF